MNASLLSTIGPAGRAPPPPPAMPPITALQSRISLFGYAVLYLFGSFGHTSSFLIFLRPILRRISTSCLFLILIIFDSIYLLVSIYYFINVGLQIRDSSPNVSAICRFRDYVQWTAMCCNAWLLVGITTDRWIRVKFPFKSKQICTRRNAFITAAVIIILSGGFNAHVLQPDYNQLPAGVMTVCGPNPRNIVYNTFVRQIWPILFSCIQTVVPVILLIILSIDIYRCLTRRTVNRNIRRRSQLDNQMLLIMLATIIMFISTNLPLGLYNILFIPVLHKFMNQVQLLQLSTILTFVATINYALDFYIHCLTSRLFRQELLHVFKCLRQTNRVDIITNTLRVQPVGLPITPVQI